MPKNENRPKQKQTLEQSFVTFHKRKKNTLSFVQYGKIQKIPAEKIRLDRYQFSCAETSLSKLEIMFIFNTADRDALSEHIRVRTQTRAEGLTVITKIKDRPVILTSEVRDTISANKPASVEILFRTGHVLQGRVRGMSKFHLMLSVNDKKVLAYIHGIHQIRVKERKA